MSIDRLVVACPDRIDSRDLQGIAKMAAEAGASFGTGVWARGGTVYDWSLLKALGHDVSAQLRDAFPGYDIAFIEGNITRPKLLMCDMDATLVVGESIDAMAEAHGVGEQVAKITERAMAGEIDFAEAVKERIAMMAGLEASVVEKIGDDMALQPGAAYLLSEIQAFEIRTVLVSGGFSLVAEKVGKRLGFDRVESNTLEIEDGKLTGKVVEPILSKDSKLEIFNDELFNTGIDAENVVAIGDGANDIPMLQAAGLGVAFQGKDVVKAATPYQINVTDLSTVLAYLDM